METLARFQQHLLPLAVDFLRLCVWLVLLMAVFVPLERLFALRGQRVFRKGFSRDLGWYFLGGLLPALLLVPLMGAIGWALHFLIPAALQAHVAAMPLAVRFAASMVVGELGFYWGHRWSHEIPRFCGVFTTSITQRGAHGLAGQHPEPTRSTSRSPRLCGIVPMYALGLVQPITRDAGYRAPAGHPSPEQFGGSSSTPTSNWRFGPLEWLVATPVFHHWHHTYEEPLNRNFAPMLPWVDRLFGTYYTPKAQWPSRYGTATPMAPNLAGQLLQPFMPTEPALLPRPGVSTMPDVVGQIGNLRPIVNRPPAVSLDRRSGLPIRRRFKQPAPRHEWNIIMRSKTRQRVQAIFVAAPQKMSRLAKITA